MIITGDDEEIERLQEQLSTEFEMKNLGGLKYFLGIEVARSRRGIFLSQRKYVLDLLKWFRMDDCKACATPFQLGVKLTKYYESPQVDATLYCRYPYLPYS